MRLNRRTVSLIWLAFAAAASWGQDGQQAGDTNPPTTEASTAITQWGTLDLAYGDWAIRGNRHKFLQYSTPGHGFYIADMNLVFPLKANSPYASIDIAAPGLETSAVSGLMQFFHGQTQLWFNFSRNEFSDPGSGPVEPSTSKLTTVTVSQAITPEIGLFVKYHRDQKDYSFQAAKDPTATRTRTTTASLEGKALGGDAAVTYTDWRFVDMQGFQPESVQRRLTGRYGIQLTPAIGLEGSLGQTRIEQTGYQDSEIKSSSIGGDWDIGPDTNLRFNFSRDSFDLPNVANAYVQDRFNSSFNLTQYWQRWNFQFGYRHRENERVTADHTYVDVPKFDQLEAKATGRINKAIRLSARWTWNRATDPATMDTTDSRLLYWDQRVRAQAKIDANLGRLLGYATYNVNYTRNTDRQVDVTTGTVTFGGSFSVADNADAYFEFSNSQTKAKGLSDVGGLDLDSFYPSATTLALGGNWTVKPNWWLAASYTYLFTDNDNPLLLPDGNFRGRYLTASLTHQFGNGNEAALTVAPWQYRDRIYDNVGYDATMVMLSFRVRF